MLYPRILQSIARPFGRCFRTSIARLIYGSVLDWNSLWKSDKSCTGWHTRFSTPDVPALGEYTNPSTKGKSKSCNNRTRTHSRSIRWSISNTSSESSALRFSVNPPDFENRCFRINEKCFVIPWCRFGLNVFGDCCWLSTRVRSGSELALLELPSPLFDTSPKGTRVGAPI